MDVIYSVFHKYEVNRIFSLLPLASCLLPLASCLLPLASCLLPVPAPCSLKKITYFKL
ncbi:MAG: hypothetical protein F6J90_25520 [Moorea sp. SIOASIH]|uniref:hypothetical protein n=1 Tax=Moorena sp. SIOASIH TaxID=2607817 RepID=UPI0013BB1744|nr:hypothetical protein [Moorena sp. SIOASIH]NEO39509.1 hypothetical protein [Moorena sp. SIOASIH]